MNQQPISQPKYSGSGVEPIELVPQDGAHHPAFRKPENVIGPAVSVILHAIFLIIAAILVINPPVRGDGHEVEIEFATLSEEELEDLDETPTDALASPLDPSLAKAIESPADLLEVDVASVAVDLADPGAIDTLGGSGDEFSPGETLEGGGSGTSFFGVESRGTRFVYIVDVSGSMSQSDRIGTLRRNLVDSINRLPSHASFLVIAYNDQAIPLHNAFRWSKADEPSKFRARAWVNKLISSGGTEPSSSFEQAFKLKPRPDVIYFMTDGQQTEVLPSLIGELNSKGRRTKINTIVFGDRGGEEVMRRIANESGGQYRYVPDEGDGP